MQDNFNFRVPGEIDGLVFADKQICLNADYHIQDRIPVTIAPNTGDLDAGTVLGASTADSLYRPVRRTALTAAVAANATTATVSDPTKFAVGNTVALIKADGTGVETVGAVSAINGDVITFATASTAAFAVNDLLFVQDGSEKALLILGDVVLDAAANKIANAYVSGKFFLTQLVGVDSIVTSDLKARSIPFGLNLAGAAESIFIV